MWTSGLNASSSRHSCSSSPTWATLSTCLAPAPPSGDGCHCRGNARRSCTPVPCALRVQTITWASSSGLSHACRFHDICSWPSSSYAVICLSQSACRTAVYQALRGSEQPPDIDVECTNPDMGGMHHSFETMLSRMEHSVFCLALPGDSPSTRRLSEIFLAGLPCPMSCCMTSAVQRGRPLHLACSRGLRTQAASLYSLYWTPMECVTLGGCYPLGQCGPVLQCQRPEAVAQRR